MSVKPRNHALLRSDLGPPSTYMYIRWLEHACYFGSHGSSNTMFEYIKCQTKVSVFRTLDNNQLIMGLLHVLAHLFCDDTA